MRNVTVQDSHEPTIIVITGPAGCGKTALSARLVDTARELGMVVRGVLSPARIVEGVKVGIDLLDLGSGECRPLAEARAATAGPATEAWRFHGDALAWGMDVLRCSLPCDLLVIDELGPLELLRGGGWVDALGLLRSGGYRWAIVVVRPGLVQRFLELAPGLETTIVRVTADDHAALLAQIARRWGVAHAHD